VRLPRRLEHGEPAELVDHLGELRGRLMIAGLAVIAASGVAFAFHEQLIELLNQPLPEGRRKPVTLGVTEPFMTSLKVSLAAGFAAALPVVLWQVWGFLAPAFERGVQRAVALLVAFGALLFAGGVAFSYFVVLPAAIRFLTTYDSDVYDIEVRASYYYSFVLASLLAVGLIFQLPVAVLGAVRLGVVTSAKLRRNRRIGYVAMAATAVVLPGVDPVSTALTMLPLVALFEASIWLAAAFERRWQAASAPAGSPA
jgi:sec-independent protein translocase protein TatC